MNKAIKVIFCLPLLFTAPAALLAAEAAPVDIVGAGSNTGGDSAVDSALQDSVATETSAEKHKKHSKSVEKSYVTPASLETPAEEPALPAANASDYTVRPGDVLQITVWKEDNLDREVVVLPDGTISFPLIGSFNANGMTPAQLQTTIKSKLHSLIPGASVAVLVKATLGHTVSVIGQVNKPGEIIMGHQLTVMQALSQAGGLTPYASEGRIIILRTIDGKESSIEFPYSDVIEGDHLDKDITLTPGDVVVVPTASLF